LPQHTTVTSVFDTHDSVCYNPGNDAVRYSQ
jgi:hypothetical protein